MLPQGRGTRAGPGSGRADRTRALSCESRVLTTGPPRDSHSRLLTTPGGQCWPPLPTAQEHPSGPALVPGARSGSRCTSEKPLMWQLVRTEALGIPAPGVYAPSPGEGWGWIASCWPDEKLHDSALQVTGPGPTERSLGG